MVKHHGKSMLLECPSWWMAQGSEGHFFASCRSALLVPAKRSFYLLRQGQGRCSNSQIGTKQTRETGEALTAQVHTDSAKRSSPNQRTPS